MVKTPYYDLDIDSTLGGSNASDYIIPSQKAVKDYVDNNSGGSPTWGNITGTLSDQTDLQNALNAKYDASNPNGYTSNVGTVTSVNNTSPDGNGNVALSIPAAQVNADWNAVSGVAEILNKPSIPTVDQTYSASSANAQSGVAMAGAISGKADASLTNLSNGLANTICTTAATTTSSATSAVPAVVVENYKNGSSWYRVWSDGWIEQGGALTTNGANKQQNLLVAFSDTDYDLQITGGYSSISTYAVGWGTTQTTTTFTTSGPASNVAIKWYACGY